MEPGSREESKLPSETQASQRVSVLQVATPSVIVATPTAVGTGAGGQSRRGTLPVTASAQIPESGALLVSQTPGSPPIIVGLIQRSDVGTSITGTSAAAVLSVPRSLTSAVSILNPKSSVSESSGTQTVTKSSSTVAKSSSTGAVSRIGHGKVIQSLNFTATQVQGNPGHHTQTGKQTGQTSKSAQHSGQSGKTSGGGSHTGSSGLQGSQAGQTGQQQSTTLSWSSKFPHEGQGGTPSSKGLATGSPAPPTPSGYGGHGAGKPKSFAAMMAVEGGGSKKHGSSAKKAQSSKSSSSKSHTSSKSKSTSSTTTTTTSSQIASDSTPQPTRTSQRSVKRPRTYDEDVAELEAMAAKSTKKSKGGASKGGGSSKASAQSKKVNTRLRSFAAAKDLGRWRPTDDLMLISAVQQTNDLAAVHLGVKFSCRFTLREVEDRWYALLYDPQISKVAMEAVRALHPGVVTMALNNALWSREEEVVLARILSTDPGHLETFQKVLKDNPCVFHACRTATSLHHHWVLMGHYGLLNNQKVDIIPPGDIVTTFTDAEDQLNDAELSRARDVREEAVHQELMVKDHQSKQEIRDLEEELPQWRTILDTGNNPEFGPDVYAILKGKVVDFLMTSREVVLGRGSPSSRVDFDLSMEAPAFKVSRRQATIQLTEEGEFYIRNEGRRPLYVDGKPVINGKQARLHHQQILEVASMSFLVLLNLRLIVASNK